MRLTKIHIENFRALKNTDIDIEENISIIVGKNNTGKTSVKALLDKFLAHDSVHFTLNDLNCNLQEAIKVQVEADINKDGTEVKLEDVPEFAIKLFLHIQYSVDDDLSNISDFITDLDINEFEVIIGFTSYLKAENYLKLLNAYKQKKSQLEKVKEANKTFDIPNVIYFLEGEGVDTFFTNFAYLVTSRDSTERYKIPDIDKKDYISRDKIQKLINYKYISAERNSLNPVANQGENTTLSTLASKYWAVSENAQENEEITNSKSRLEAQFLMADSEFTQIYGEVFQKTLDDVAKLSDSKDKLKIESSFQARNLLSENTKVVYEHGTTKLPEYYNGLGYMNLIEVIFKLTLIKRQFEEYNNSIIADINLLFIEEPEAHMHPQMQVIFIKNIKDLLQLNNGQQVQTLLSTHSSYIAANSDIDSFRYFYNSPDVGIKVKNLRDLKPKKEIPKIKTDSTEQEKLEKAEIEAQYSTYRFVKQYVTLTRSEVFFADKIIIIEGDTERILMPIIMKRIDDDNMEDKTYSPMLSQNISIIEAGAFAKEFDELIKFLEIKTLIITDIDYNNDDGKCNSSKATSSSNSTINFYLSGKTLGQLKIATNEEKQISSNLYLTYQQEENHYHARSFEDSFISINHEWLKQHITQFCERDAIKNAKMLKESSDFYEIAENCIKSKTAFALTILYESSQNIDINWYIPQYIREGLLWLSK